MTIPERGHFASSPPIGGAKPPSVTRRVLPNGLTVLVQQDKTHPLVALQAAIRTGSATEGEYLGCGISHVLEHMLFKGTARRPVGAVEREARAYGGTSQGYTTYDTTSYQLTVNKEFWAQAADLLMDAVFHSSLDSEEFVKERGVVLRELKMGKDDPDHLIWELLFSNAFRVHPYRVPIIGYEPLVSALTREDIAAYHRKWYVPNNIVVSVVGDIEPEAVVKEIERLTADLQTGKPTLEPLPPEPQQLTPREVSQQADVEVGIGAIGFHSVSVADPDLFPLDLLARLLGGYRGSRLDKALKETGIVHSIGSWNYTPAEPGLFVVTMRMDEPNTAKAVELIFAELERAKRELFSDQEIEASKLALIRTFVEDKQTVTGQAADLSGNELLIGDPGFSYRYLEAMQKVTAEDLRRVAQKYLIRDRATIATILPRSAAIAEKVKESGSEKPAVEKKVLPNGVTVVLREDHRIPLATAQVSMLGGSRFENEKNNGVSVLAFRMLLRGTRTRDAERIVEEANRLGAVFAPFAGRNSGGMAFEATSARFNESLALAADLIVNSIFPAEELEKERRVLLANLKMKEEDPFPWGVRRLMGTLFSLHPYKFDPMGSLETVPGVSQKDVAEFYAKVRDPKRMTISVIGDFKKAEVLAAIEQTFGRISAPAANTVVVPQEPTLDKLRERVETTARREGLLMIAFPGLPITDPDVPKQDLIDAVLSGGAGRLFEEVREKRGLAYTVGSFPVYGPDPGAFILYAITDPGQLEATRAVLFEQIEKIRSVPVPEEELKHAKQGLLGNRRINRQAQTALASQMSLDELYGLGYDYPERYDAAVQKLTAQDLTAFAKKQFDTKRCAVVIGKPLPGTPPPEKPDMAEALDAGPHGKTH